MATAVVNHLSSKYIQDEAIILLSVSIKIIWESRIIKKLIKTIPVRTFWPKNSGDNDGDAGRMTCEPYIYILFTII